MTQFHALKSLPQGAGFDEKDVLVIFGELFDRGYANGLVAAAEAYGMKVIEGTVGRRDREGNLSALPEEEIAKKNHSLINVPLEAGFDLHPDASGSTPCDRLQGVKISAWQDVKLDFAALESARAEAKNEFRNRTQKFFSELEKQLASNFSGRLVLAHTMAGGVPRAKIVLPLMNRVFKGTGERYLSSKEFWDSEIGRFCSMNFDEVTADTLDILIEESAKLRDKIEKAGGQVAYVAYGYHGTEVQIKGELRWQTYSPYLQGWAKLRLEDHAHRHSEQGTKVTVFNCPEILTNSSSIFQGVEVSLYPLIAKLAEHPTLGRRAQTLLEQCQARLQEGTTFKDLTQFTDSYLTDKVILETSVFEQWPQHSSQEQLATMLGASEKLREMHKDTKVLITELLSEAVFTTTGKLMLDEAFHSDAPVIWLGHDIISEHLAKA